ncbi:MAG: response regulator, partial [Acidobacteria bacterium]|nr:response regulator [Acidobacteriota bacterium]
MLAPAVGPPSHLELARVLLVHGELAPRLALQTLLRAGGYSVDVAASAAEAFAKLDENHYELVLSDVQMESPDAGVKLLAYARVKEYQPATALVTAYHDHKPHKHKYLRQVSIDTEDVSTLLAKVAEL